MLHRKRNTTLGLARLTLSKLSSFCILLLFCATTFECLGISIFKENGRQKTSKIVSIENEIDLNDNLWIAEDGKGQFTIDDIRMGRYEKIFKPNKNLPKPLKTDATYWAKIKVKSDLDHSTDWLMTIGTASYATVFIERSNEILETKKAGYYLPASQKDVPIGKKHKVKLTINPQETLILYIRINETTNTGPRYDVNLIHKDKWVQQINKRNIWQSLFHGAMMMMILFNLAYLFMTRDKSYLYYTLYMLCTSVYFLHFHNLTRELFLVEYPFFHGYLWLVALICFCFYFQFIRTFLNTKTVLEKWDPYFKGLVIFDFSVFFLNFIYYVIAQDFPTTIFIQNVTILCSLIFIVVVVIRVIRVKSIPARIFIVGNLSLAVFAFVGVYSYFALNSSLGLSYLQAGIIVEGLIFSLGIGYGYRSKEKIKSTDQVRIIDELKEKDKLSQEINTRLDVKLIENDSRLRMQFKKQQIINDQLTKSNDEMRQISYITSHNLKSPVRALHSLATWLSRDYGPKIDEEGNQKLELMVSKVNRLDSLLTNILEFLNIGQENESNTKVDVNDLLYDLIGQINIPTNFNIKIAHSLPVLIGKKSGIRQIFQNIIAYLIHLDDGLNREIEIISKEDLNGLVFQIRDSGLDMGDHEKKLNLFHVLNSENEISSSGIGLSIAKKWIEKFGGEIWIKDTDEPGVSFFFSLSRDRMVDEESSIGTVSTKSKKTGVERL